MLKRERVSSGSEATDTLLCRVKTQKEANEIRNKVMQYKRKSIVYVFSRKKSFDIFVSNEFGGMPTDEHYEELRSLAHGYDSEPTTESQEN